MVKAVVGEETQLKLIEDRLIQSRLPVQAHTHSLSLSTMNQCVHVCMNEMVENLNLGFCCRWVWQLAS